MMTAYLEQSGSTKSSRNNIPSVYRQLESSGRTHHVLYLRLGAGEILKSNRIAHVGTKPTSNFLGDTLGDRDGGDLSRLSTSQLAVLEKTLFGQVLRHLSRFARTSVTHNNKNLVLGVSRRTKESLHL